jgi:hypothetical protein
MNLGGLEVYDLHTFHKHKRLITRGFYIYHFLNFYFKQTTLTHFIINQKFNTKNDRTRKRVNNHD